MDITTERLVKAWKSGDNVYPPEPKAEKQRWFLRTGEPNLDHRSALVIGMNPSTAVELGLQRDGYSGDNTTDKILKRFSLQHLDRTPAQQNEPIFSEIVIVNLIPHVGKPEDLPRFDDQTVSLPVKDSIGITKQLWELILESVTDVILIWGNPKDKDYPWKEPVLKELLPFLQSITRSKTLWAAVSRSDPQYPYHPRYPKWITVPIKEITIDLED